MATTSYQQLKAPWRYWLKNSWFPVSVLVVSIATAVASSLIAVWAKLN